MTVPPNPIPVQYTSLGPKHPVAEILDEPPPPTVMRRDLVRIYTPDILRDTHEDLYVSGPSAGFEFPRNAVGYRRGVQMIQGATTDDGQRITVASAVTWGPFVLPGARYLTAAAIELAVSETLSEKSLRILQDNVHRAGLAGAVQTRQGCFRRPEVGMLLIPLPEDATAIPEGFESRPDAVLLQDQRVRGLP